MTKYNHEFPCQIIGSLIVGVLIGALVYAVGYLFGTAPDVLLKVTIIFGCIVAVVFFLIFCVCWRLGHKRPSDAEVKALRKIIVEHWDITGLR